MMEHILLVWYSTWFTECCAACHRLRVNVSEVTISSYDYSWDSRRMRLMMPCFSVRFRKVSPSKRSIFAESTWWMNAVLREDVWSLLDNHHLNRKPAQNRRVHQPSTGFDPTKLLVPDDGQYWPNHPMEKCFDNEFYRERNPVCIDALDTNSIALWWKRRRHQSTDVPRILRIGNVVYDVAVLFCCWLRQSVRTPCLRESFVLSTQNVEWDAHFIDVTRISEDNFI